jgi:DNA replication protein DnaC
LPRSAPPVPSPLKSLDCLCRGAGALLMDREDAVRTHAVILDSYAGRVLIPCDCTDGRQRAAKWRNLPREAAGVYLTSGVPIAAQTAAQLEIAAFVADPRGWLTLIGGYGVGKTRLIYAALNHLADAGVYGRYVMMPELLNELRDALRDDDYGERLRRFVEAPLLAIDELDKIRDTDFVDDVLQAIFLARYQQRETLATIIGYNADRADRLPAFLLSRINDSRFRLIELGGRDLRPIAHKLEPWDRGEGEL